MNYAGNYIKHWFAQKPLYSKPNTVEYQTHHEDRGRAKGEEGILIAKMLKLYEQRMPENSKRHIARLISFYDWYFESYSDPIKAKFYREKLTFLDSKHWK